MTRGFWFELYLTSLNGDDRSIIAAQGSGFEKGTPLHVLSKARRLAIIKKSAVLRLRGGDLHSFKPSRLIRPFATAFMAHQDRWRNESPTRPQLENVEPCWPKS